MFQVCSLVSISKDLSANLWLPVFIDKAWGMIASPTYWTTVFRNFLPGMNPVYDYTHMYDMVSTNQQFTYRDFSDHKDTDDRILVHGVLMNTKYFLHNLDYLREKITPMEGVEYRLQDTTFETVCLGVRRFVEEKKQDEWAFPKQYFVDALNRFFETYEKRSSTKPLRFAVFTDDSSWCTDFLNEYQAQTNRHFQVVLFQSKRDGMTDTQHFFEMMLCNHFILCSSTFHYWGALLAEKPDSIVVCCPRSFLNDLVLPHWLRVDF